MPDAMDRYVTAQVVAKYICTGEEDGLQEAIVNNSSYFFLLENAAEGAVIIYKNGHFYTNYPSMVIKFPDEEVNKDVDSSDVGNTQTIGTSDKEVYTKLPADVTGAQTIKVIEKDDDIRAYYKNGTEWVEIPILTNEQVEYYLNNVLLKKVRFTQTSTNVEVT